jgi:hypothetical protein
MQSISKQNEKKKIPHIASLLIFFLVQIRKIGSILRHGELCDKLTYHQLIIVKLVHHDVILVFLCDFWLDCCVPIWTLYDVVILMFVREIYVIFKLWSSFVEFVLGDCGSRVSLWSSLLLILCLFMFTCGFL